MSVTSLTFSAAAAYLLASYLIGRRLGRVGDANAEVSGLITAFLPALIAAGLHVYLCLATYSVLGSFDFSLSGMLVLVSAMLSTLFLLACTAMPIARLGIMVFPLSAISLIFAYWWNSEVSLVAATSQALTAHVLLSIAAYALLSIATIQAILYVYQERQIKHRTKPGMLLALPPLQTMEQLLFRLLMAGFILLTIALLSGAVFSQQIFGRAFEFKHHTVLALMGWAVYGTLLAGWLRAGWRGKRAVWWSLAGFVLIQLGYFGTKIVSESLNIS